MRKPKRIDPTTCRDCGTPLTIGANARQQNPGICLDCRREYARLYAQKWRKRNPTGKATNNRRDKLKRHYGLTVEAFEAMRDGQGGLCAICRKRPARAVDHCHKTGRIRGILCITCNSGLGHFHDDLETMRRAIAYIQGLEV